MTGKMHGGGEGKTSQHRDLYRKVLLRRNLLRGLGEGAAYVPFIGDGDIAVQVYIDREIFGADLDGARVKVAAGRISAEQGPDSPSILRVSDCDTWPFADMKVGPLAVGDFDSYSYPYDSFRAAWAGGDWAKRCVLFFTDAQRMAIYRAGRWRWPEGSEGQGDTRGEKEAAGGLYFARHVLPWFAAYVKPYRVVRKLGYSSGSTRLVYWGALIERT